MKKIHRISLAIAALAACGAVSAQQAFITQSGSNDQATIEQNGPPGSALSAGIQQAGGSDNQATVMQLVPGVPPTAPSSANANISQQGTVGAIGRIDQVGTNVGATAQLNQIGGTGSQANLSQFNTNNTRLFVDQAGSTNQALAQQQDGVSNATIRIGQTGNGSIATAIQGQPSGTVANSSARVFQTGDTNTAFSLQAAGGNSNVYINQGGATQPGFYFSPSRGWVEVDGTVAAGPAFNSTANVNQNSGLGHTGYILQYGTGHNASVTQAGDSNHGGVLQSGTGNSGHVVQTGMMGRATIGQYGTGQTANITQSGVGNNASVKQR